MRADAVSNLKRNSGFSGDNGIQVLVVDFPGRFEVEDFAGSAVEFVDDLVEMAPKGIRVIYTGQKGVRVIY